MSILELRAVSKFYDGALALNGCSLQVEAGERLVIFGPSGCGKTTILRLIAGFIAPDEGRIFLHGKQVSGKQKILVPAEKRNVGMVFQDLALWPHLTVFGNIEFGLKAHGLPKRERKKRIAEFLERMGLAGLENRKPFQLSGGQQQRVALARALILQPEILLMDEPLSSLDLELNIRLRREVVRLQEKFAFTLLYVTHDREEAFCIAKRMVVLKNGRILFDGKAEEARRFLEVG